MILITNLDVKIEEPWSFEYWLHDRLMNLLDTSTFEGKARQYLEMEITNTDMTEEDYNRIILILYNNQLDRISSGLPYSQTDILKHLRKLC